MKIKLVFGLILLFTLVSAVYAVLSQSKFFSPDSTNLVELENPPSTSTHSAEIKNIEEKIENTTELVEAEPTEKNDAKAMSSLQQVVAEFFDVENLPSSTISQQTETHAQGEFGQKWWLAFNDKNDGWKVVASGCSYINCGEISEYNFPTEMAPVCWDTNNNKLVNR